jgi:hypothetical protein
MLSVDDEWFDVRTRLEFNRLFLEGTAKNQPGMSGSPILRDDGAAIGLVSTGSPSSDVEFYSGVQPVLRPRPSRVAITQG